MTEWLEIFIDGNPVPKERHRFRGKRAYSTKRTKEYEHLVRQAAMLAMNGKSVIEGPVEVDMLVLLSTPKSWSPSRREDALNGKILPVSRPDGDNVCKSVLDALNGLVFKDDAQVVDLRIRKKYGEKAGVLLRVREFSHENKENIVANQS